MGVWTVTNLDHKRAGYPSGIVSEAHVTITDDFQFHITLIHRGDRNHYFYNGKGRFLRQRGNYADYLYDNYKAAHNVLYDAAWDEFTSVSMYMA